MLIWSRPHCRVGPSSAPWWGHGSSEAVCDQGDQLESSLCTGQAQVSSACTELQKRPVGKPDQRAGPLSDGAECPRDSHMSCISAWPPPSPAASPQECLTESQVLASVGVRACSSCIVGGDPCLPRGATEPRSPGRCAVSVPVRPWPGLLAGERATSARTGFAGCVRWAVAWMCWQNKFAP